MLCGTDYFNKYYNSLNLQGKKMYNLLKRTKYIYLNEFINKELAYSLADDFESFCTTGGIGGDSQCPKSSAFYNYAPFLQLLCDKNGALSEFLGEGVVPTYSFARVYKNGCDLKPHVDATRCEISITCHLRGDEEWPFYVNGEEKVLKPGDAVLYLGNEAEHWRKPYTGEKYTQVFLHYVRTNGPHFSNVFDLNRHDFSN